jgi:hypothetical protein
MDTQRKRCCFVLGVLIAWRIAYFPVMVLAGTAAAMGEWLSYQLPFVPVWIYPTFFVGMAVSQGLIAYLVSLMIKGKWLVYIPALILAAPAVLISFSTPGDLTLLPDYNWSPTGALPPVAQPAANPYLSDDVRDTGFAPRTVQLAGAALYEIIPDVPWSNAVKGTLERAFKENPRGTTRDRLDEHYGAFLAAHELIGRPSQATIRPGLW